MKISKILALATLITATLTGALKLTSLHVELGVLTIILSLASTISIYIVARSYPPNGKQ